MNAYTNITENQGEVIGHIGWKYYNTIKKKAMEQEFSWSGLFLSLSIAFFIVISSALVLSFTYQSLESTKISQNSRSFQIYMLENINTRNFKNYINHSEIGVNTLIIEKKSEIV
ncbi:hypothetical protein C0583_06695 [Candidatus Parcubacteria bacterium]|nr:MAG: hypothetical protein C0583_06695 [Candidatus Parcubacteria bacterium]